METAVFIAAENTGGTWGAIVCNEWLEDNPKLLSALPVELKNHEVNLEVSERLRQLSTALKKFG